MAPRRTNLDIELVSRALDTAAVRHVALANPEHAPVRCAAIAALQLTVCSNAFGQNWSTGERRPGCSSLNQHGRRAGIHPRMSLAQPAGTAAGRYWLIPSRLHPSLEQAGAILCGPPTGQRGRSAGVHASGVGSAILKRFGFFSEEK